MIEEVTGALALETRRFKSRLIHFLPVPESELLKFSYPQFSHLCFGGDWHPLGVLPLVNSSAGASRALPYQKHQFYCFVGDVDTPYFYISRSLYY